MLDGYTVKPCGRICRITFHSENGCCHGFKFCEKCNELWDVSTYTECPRSKHSGNERCAPSMEIMDVLGTNLPYDSSDAECDDLCFHMFKVLDSDMCRHQMSYCSKCYNVWDGCTQCPCNEVSETDDDDESKKKCSEVSETDDDDESKKKNICVNSESDDEVVEIENGCPKKKYMKLM